MKKRPVLVTILSIILLAIGCLSLFLCFVALINGAQPRQTIFQGVPDEVLLFFMYLSASALLAGGILSLLRNGAGRYVIVGWSMIALFLYADSILPRIAYLLILVLVFFNKSSNRYFQKDGIDKEMM